MNIVSKALLGAAAVLAAAAGSAALAGEGRGGMHRGGMGGMGGLGMGGVDVATIDADGDGAASRAELVARALARLSAHDANGDGFLDRAEIVAVVPARMGFGDVFGADPAQRMADRFLAEHGGTETGRVEIAAVAEDRVNRLLAGLDDDADGALSPEEAAAARGQGRHRP